jgi:alkyl hydroperoxide reductase subunit AhpC
MFQDTAPDFTLDGYHKGDFIQKTLSKDYVGKNVILFFYPNDFTYLCPHEILEFSSSKPEFDKLDTEVVFISCDSKYVHKAWNDLGVETGGVKGNLYPMLSDFDRKICKSYNMLDKKTDVSFRGTIILDKEREMRYYSVYDNLIKRKVDEILRVVQNIKFLDENKDGVAFCPINFRISKDEKNK